MCLETKTGCIYTSRHVQFVEDIFPYASETETVTETEMDVNKSAGLVLTVLPTKAHSPMAPCKEIPSPTATATSAPPPAATLASAMPPPTFSQSQEGPLPATQPENSILQTVPTVPITTNPQPDPI